MVKHRLQEGNSAFLWDTPVLRRSTPLFFWDAPILSRGTPLLSGILRFFRGALRFFLGYSDSFEGYSDLSGILRFFQGELRFKKFEIWIIPFVLSTCMLKLSIERKNEKKLSI